MKLPFVPRRELDATRAANQRLLRQISELSADLSETQRQLARCRRQVDALNAEAERRVNADEALAQRRADWAHAARNGLYCVIGSATFAAAEQAPLEPPPSSDGLDEVWDAVMRKSS